MRPNFWSILFSWYSSINILYIFLQWHNIAYEFTTRSSLHLPLSPTQFSASNCLDTGIRFCSDYRPNTFAGPLWAILDHFLRVFAAPTIPVQYTWIRINQITKEMLFNQFHMKILLQSHTQFVPTHEKKVMASKINILFASALSRINFKSSAGNRWLLHTFLLITFQIIHIFCCCHWQLRWEKKIGEKIASHPPSGCEQRKYFHGMLAALNENLVLWFRINAASKTVFDSSLQFLQYRQNYLA